ncbi:hypothetical protein Pmani_029674 [Petrolisthes manimaculis]|uniref:Uncharacterized protein n=1 Tax=Petrolisthes manimaculis TaxID=1843537 RepID=A0AAE1NX62_9EUCA|nr:hypothetical protein Pmani_029674 [Petrolisthes manimaculis]
MQAKLLSLPTPLPAAVPANPPSSCCPCQNYHPGHYRPTTSQPAGPTTSNITARMENKEIQRGL